MKKVIAVSFLIIPIIAVVIMAVVLWVVAYPFLWSFSQLSEADDYGRI